MSVSTLLSSINKTDHHDITEILLTITTWQIDIKVYLLTFLKAIIYNCKVNRVIFKTTAKSSEKYQVFMNNDNIPFCNFSVVYFHCLLLMFQITFNNITVTSWVFSRLSCWLFLERFIRCFCHIIYLFM
jgi:hypothetical protein